jgi:MSHA pilin protein MshD
MSSSRQRGVSLIEAVVFIVVLGIGIAGMAVLYNQLTVASVDPLIRKQALAIARSLMEEIQLRPFTFCDPDDPAVVTAASPAACDPARIENIGAESFAPFGMETRNGATRYDNVNDYDLFSMSGIVDANNNSVIGLESYAASVAVANAGGDFPGGIPADAALRITVTVTGPANVSVALQGYRLRYAPNAP